ncbi:MAG: glycoside hydrolase family 43 protein [Sediminibacterium sp.]
MKRSFSARIVVFISAMLIFWACRKDGDTRITGSPEMLAQLQTLSDTSPIYMFCYFKEGNDGLHLAYSLDGYTFAVLDNDRPFLVPLISNEKLMRDPCIIRGADSLFHLVWTPGWDVKGIGYSSSRDLVHWSEQKYLPVMEYDNSARNCWAPEITYDKNSKTYMVYWASTVRGLYPMPNDVESGYNHRIYYATTKDFTAFSPTMMLYDHGFNVIDATIIPDDNRYIMFLKDETLIPVNQKNIRLASGNNLKGPYSAPSVPITGNYWTEGPTVTKIRNQWVVYFDKYNDKVVGAVSSEDLINWTDISSKIVFPVGVKHGSVFVIAKKEFLSFFL